MIIIKKLINYSKTIGIFILLEIFISFIMGFLNLIGLNRSLGFVLTFIINLTIFFITGYKAGIKTKHKGFIEGAINGLLLITPLFILSLVFFHHDLSWGTLLYYILLIISSVISATIGKNKKADSSIQDKN